MSKPTIPSGMRDFSPTDVVKRQYIFNTIRSVFEKYGYQPIETPTMENLSTLEGKYGEEGDRLLFRILNSGDYHKKIVEVFNNRFAGIESWREYFVSESEKEAIDDNERLRFSNMALNRMPERERLKSLREEILAVFPAIKSSDFTENISEKGLRYDLTVPFARYVVMHQHEITFPFKRYQVQPVFRADRPQRGRYREFYQCDADVVGSDSLINEMELIRMYDEVFDRLGIQVVIKLNNRKILAGMAERADAMDKFTDITLAIDKLDKIGLQGVRQELIKKELTEGQLQLIEKFFTIRGTARQMIEAASDMLQQSATGMKGVEELQKIYQYLELSGPTKAEVVIDFSLARGLNYYTGAILEVAPLNIRMGSIGGGGRYDDLTGIFGLKGVSGVGISFGADRIFDVMEELKLFPETVQAGTKVLFVHLDEASLLYALPLVQQVRAEGIAAELYPATDKIKKQMKYAGDKDIPFVVLIGENERTTGKLTLRHMKSGEQEALSVGDVILRLQEHML